MTDTIDVIDSKHFTESVSSWGVIILTVSQVMNIGITPGEAATVASAAAEVVGVYSHVLAAIGICMAAFGRWNAKQPLHFRTPYSVDASGNKIAATKPA